MQQLVTNILEGLEKLDKIISKCTTDKAEQRKRAIFSWEAGGVQFRGPALPQYGGTPR